MINTIFNESHADTMSRMRNGFVNLIVTSPPYDDLRSYCGYDFSFKKMATEFYRIISDGGVVVWNVGDQTNKGSESGTSFRQVLYFMGIGFLLHDTMIYKKVNANYSANDDSNRYTQIFEFMFILSKGTPNTHNLIKDKLNITAGNINKSSKLQADGSRTKISESITRNYGYRTNIWEFNNTSPTKDKIAYENPAIFPEGLPRDHIKTWTNPGDIVYDPFSGSGTTAKMALLLNRHYIGSELSKKYYKVSLKRLDPYLKQQTLEL